MTKLTKFTFTLVGIFALVLITAVLVGQAYNFRGYFAVGGEWLLPLVAVEVRAIYREIRKVFRNEIR